MTRRIGSLTRRWLFLGGIGLLVALLGALQPHAVGAASCTVTSTADSGAGSLRAAIGDTNCTTITFSLPNPSTITLTTGDLAISRSLTITGPGAAALTISGDNKYRVFNIANPTVAISGLTLTNGKSSGDGGGVYLGGGKLTLSDSVVRNSAAGSYGGGIANYGGQLTVTGSTISGNSSSNGGGGIFSISGTLTATSITVSGNTANDAGGIENVYGVATLTNCTVASNQGGITGGVFTGALNDSGTTTLTNCTVAGNTGWGIANVSYGTFATTRLQNSVVAGNTGGSFYFFGANTSLVSLGYNVSGDTSGAASLTAAGDLNNTDPLIGALGSYGGATQTRPLLPGSPAIDRVPATGANCPAADQRGIARPQTAGLFCDSGAFESRGFTLAYTNGSGQSAVINTAFASSLVTTVSSANSEPVAGGVVTFTGPGSGAGIQSSPRTATIAANGQASASVTANGTAGGPYTVTASAAGAASTVTFSLTNLGIPTTLVAADASGKFGHTATLSATLTATSGGATIPGKTIAFTLNGNSVGSATTNASGVATLSNASLAGIAEGTYASGVGASFAGDSTYTASTDTAQLAVTPAVCVVTSTFNSGAGTLRAAIDQTDGFSGCDTITFSLPNPSTITLTSGNLTINRNLTITGPGAAALTVSGGNTSNIFAISSGTVAISGLTIADGKSSGVAGGIYLGAAKLTLSDSVVRDSVAANDGGGIKQDGGTLELIRVTVRDNTTQNAGGGIEISGGTLTVNGSTISGNTASGGSGGITSLGGTTTITDSTISNNSANQVGGVYIQDGDVTLTNCTIVGNRSGLIGGVGIVSAGRNITTTLTNCTVAGNTGLGIRTSTFGSFTATTRLQNSVAMGNTGGNIGFLGANSSLVSLGYNVSGDNTGVASLTATGDLNNTNPLLASLGSYGGPTQTMPLLPGSPAIDRVPATGANCPATDQRGVARPQTAGLFCDSGAVESRGFALASSSGDGQSAVINAAFASPLVATVSSANGEPVAGGVVTFTGPGSGADIQNSPRAITIDAQGQASASVTANGTTGGPYSVTASAAGATGTPTFSLTNLAIPPTLVAADASGTYGGTVTLSATLTATSGGAGLSGKTIAFTLNGTAVCGGGGQPACPATNTSGVATLSGVSLGSIGANTYPAGVGASFAGDATYATSSDTAQLSVAQAASTTTATATNATYTGSPYAGASATATGVGGLNTPVTDFTYAGRNSTTYGPTSTPPTNVGDYAATASYGGDTNHEGSSGSADFTIGKATQSITFATPSASPAPSYTYGTDSGFTVGATATSGLAVGFASTTTNVCTVADTAVTIQGAGDCTIVASQPGDTNHTAATNVSRTFAIAKAPTTTTVTAPNAAYTGSQYAGASATATGFGGLNVPATTITYKGRGTTTYAESSTPPTNVGDYTASASYNGDTNHEGSSGSKDFSITKASQSITFNPNPLPNRANGDAPFSLVATASSGLAVAFIAGPSGVCTINVSMVTIVGVGTCTVTANQAGNANYLPATDVVRTFQVVQAATTTSVRSEATYGDTTATLTATVTRTSGGQPVPQGGRVTFSFNGATYQAATNAQGVATATAPLPRGQAAGTFAGRVQAAYAGAAATLPSSGSGSLTVARRVLVVKPADQTVKLKQANPTSCTLALANGSSFVSGDTWAALNLTNLRCQYSRNPASTNATEKVGSTYRITALGASSTNYDIRYEVGTLTVVP